MARRATANVIGVMLVALVLAAGCDTLRKTEAPVLLFPPPPAKPRIQFLTWASGAAQVEAAKSDFAKFVSLVDTFLTLPCTATLQINVIDRETLLKAREDPASTLYRTLIVRVWGFSAPFVSLSPALQEHVLSRTEHGMV